MGNREKTNLIYEIFYLKSELADLLKKMSSLEYVIRETIAGLASVADNLDDEVNDGENVSIVSD